MFTKYLPKFKVLEVNNLTGLRNGHIIAQTNAASDIKSVTKGDEKFVENGIIVGLGANTSTGAAEVQNFDKAKHTTMFLHYTEELNPYTDELDCFAVPVDADYGTYLRCIALYVGDTFTTDNYDNGDTDGETDAKYAKVVGGQLTLQTAADADSAFIVTKGTLPNGKLAYEFTYYKFPAQAA